MPNAFAGIVYPDVFQVSDLIDSMLSPLQYRASGNKHFFTFKNFQIGSFGKGFTTNKDQTIYLALDGWVENLQEEDLIRCYLEEGISFLEKVSGEFALALLDKEKNHLYLARDPIGKKPLYWYHDKSYFLFSSELKGLLATGIVPQAQSPDAIAAYLYFGYTPQDLTLVRDVNKLLPAHYLFLNNFHSKQIKSYWSYSSYFEKRMHQHQNTILSTLNELLIKSTAARLPEKGAPGCIISGGLASGAIAHYVKSTSQNHNLKAFTASFEGESKADIDAARLVAENLHLPHIISNVTPDFFLKHYPKIAWHLDEPLADLNVLATWLLAETASQYTDTAFSGMGSDELFAGHTRYASFEKNFKKDSFLKQHPLFYSILIRSINWISPKKAIELIKKQRGKHLQFNYLNENVIFTEAALQEASPKYAAFFDPEIFLNKFYNIFKIHSNVSRLLYFDAKTRLPDLFIQQYERLMSVHKIQWQTPFLDRHLIEYAASLPEPENLDEKHAAFYLKPLIKGIFPPQFIERPKTNRKLFLSSWVDYDPIANIFYLLKKGTLIETGIISKTWLNQQLASREQMKTHFRELFAILALEVWFRLFINRQVNATIPNLTLEQLLEEN